MRHKRNICVLCCILWSVLCLSGCAEKEEASGICLKTEQILITEIAIPKQISFEGTSFWVLSADNSKNIYRMDSVNGGVQEIAWREATETALCVASNSKGDILLFTYDDGCIVKKALQGNGSWSTVREIECPNENGNEIQSVYVDGEDNIYVLQQKQVRVFDRDGMSCGRYDFSGKITALRRDDEDMVECLVQNNAKLSLYTLEKSSEDKKLKWSTEVTGSFVVLTGDDAEEIWGIADNELIGISSENGMIFARESLENTDILTGQIFGGYFRKQDVSYLYAKSSQGNLMIYEVQQGEQEKEERRQLVYGTLYLDSSVKEKIVEFNKSNPDYYITIKTYGTADMESGLTRLQMEIVSGEGPDIIDLYWIDNYEKYARLGALEDLTPYLEKQEEDIMWQLYEPYKVNGKAYMLMPHFGIGVLLVQKEDVEGASEWNISSFFDIIEANAGKKDVFPTTYKERFLWTGVWGMKDMFIDTENRRANFECGEFIELLGFVNRYGKDSFKVGETTTVEDLANRTIFYNITLQDPVTYLALLRAYEKEVLLLGYPTLAGESYPVNACADAMGISAASENKEGAWEFLRMFLEEDYQKNSDVNGFPIYKDLVIECLYESREMSYMQDGKEIPALSKEEIDMFLKILDEGVGFSAGKTPGYMEDIVTEEASAYFSGNMSAERVAKNIQNRIQLILDEQ